MSSRSSHLPTLDAHGQSVAAMLSATRRVHAAGALIDLAKSHPRSAATLVSSGFGDLQALTEGLIDHLCQALVVRRPALYAHQVEWWKQTLAARGVDTAALRHLLVALRDQVARELPAEAAPTAAAIADAGLAHFDAAPEESIERADDLVADAGAQAELELARRYLLAALEGRKSDALQLAEGAVEAGMGSRAVLSKVLGYAQAELGRMWQRGEINVAEEHLASRITEHVLVVLAARAPRAAGIGKRVLLTSASGDLHDIGLRVVADQFEAAGWDVVFLGANTPAADVARAVCDFAPDLVAVAAKLALHVRATAELIQAIRDATPERELPVLVGGAPFQLVPDLWQIVGADGVASTALDAVRVAESLTTRAA